MRYNHLKLGKRILLFLVFSLLAMPGKSNDFLGGDITWKFLGSNKYEVTLTIYKRCSKDTFPVPELRVNCAATNDSIIYTKNYISKSEQEVSPVCDTVCNSCLDTTCGSSYGIKKIEYKYQVTIPSSCCQVRLSYAYGFLSKSLDNIKDDPNNTVYLESLVNVCQNNNNSIDFYNHVPSFLCMGKNHQVSLGGYDHDKGSKGLSDSVVYELVAPKTSRNSSVTYESGFSKSIPVTTNSSFQLDNNTGLLSFKPIKEEEALVAISVKEYRNGTLIGEIIREFTLLINSCPPHAQPQISGLDGNDTSDFHLCANANYEFKIKTSDLDVADTLAVSIARGNLPPDAKINISNDREPTITINWTPGDSVVTDLPYSFSINATDQLCPILSQKERVFRFFVHPSFEVQIVDSIIDCNQALFKINNEQSGNSYNWRMPGVFDITSDSFTYYFKNKGSLPYIVAASNGSCTRFIHDTFHVDTIPVFTLPGDTTICEGQSVKLNASGGVSYNWSPAKGLDNDVISNPVSSPDTSVDYVLEIGFSSACHIFDTVRVGVIQKPDINYTVTNPACNKLHFSIDTLPAPWVHEWVFNTSSSFSSDLLKYVFSTDSFEYQLNVFNGQCNYTVDDKIKPAGPIPHIFAGDDTMLCIGDTITLNATGLAVNHWEPSVGLIDTTVEDPELIATSTQSYILNSWSVDSSCFSTDTVDVFVDTSCVWPGDANHDGVVNNYDILNIGLGYSNTGQKRKNASTDWQAFPAFDWGKNFKSGLNQKHADCNGDGLIDSSDVEVLSLNYSLTRNKKGGSNKGPNDPPISISLSKDTVGVNDTTLTGVISFGTQNKPASGIYGVVFSLNFKKQLVDSTSFSFSFNNSWLGKSNELVAVVYNDYGNGKVDFGIARKDGKGKNGFGELLTVKVVPIDNVDGKREYNEFLKFKFSNIKIVDPNLEEQPYNTEDDSVLVTGLTSGLKEQPGISDMLSIYPNPASNKLTIESNVTFNRILITDVVGKTYLDKIYLPTNKVEINTQDFKAGMYTIRILTKTGQIGRTTLSITK